MTTYYEILGVSATASYKDIKAAYRSKAQELHPDKPTGNTEAFAELQEAYDTLKNTDTREHYDEFGTAPQKQKPIEDVAVEIIMQGFAQWANAVFAGQKSISSDCISDLRSAIQNNLLNMRKNLQGLNQALTKVDSMLGKFSTTDESQFNFFESHLQGQKSSIFQQKDQIGKQLEFHEAAIDILEHFTYSPEGGLSRPQYAPTGSGYSTATTTFR